MIKLLDILLEEKQKKYNILKQLRSPEDREKSYIIATQQKIQQYIKKGSKGDLDLRYTKITSLPDNLTVGGHLYLSDTPPITSLPDNLTVGGNLELSYAKITSLPNNLTVRGYLNLSNSLIRALPDNFTVGGSLELKNTEIRSLPDNLTVRGDLWLTNTPILSLPNNLTVGGNLHLKNTPLSNTSRTRLKIRQMVPGVKGTIYT